MKRKNRNEQPGEQTPLAENVTATKTTKDTKIPFLVSLVSFVVLVVKAFFPEHHMPSDTFAIGMQSAQQAAQYP